MRNDFCSNFLAHSAKDKTWANHRYVGKVKLSSGKYLYFYDMAKYQRYLKGKDLTKGGSAITKAQTDEVATNAMRTNKTGSNTLSTYSSKSVAEKKAITQSYINTGKEAAASLTSKASSSTVAAGKTKMQELLEKAKAKADTSSSKKKGSGSSSSSSKKSSGSSKSKSSSSKKSAGSKSAKESTGKSSAAKTTKEKVTKETKTDDFKPIPDVNIASRSLKRLLGVKDESVNKHATTTDLLNKLKTYSDGAYGYIVAGNNKTYKWTKKDGKIVFTDFKSEKEVSLPSALKNIEEFRTDKKNKK